MPNLTLVSAVDTFLGSADQAAMRTNLGLGSIATQAANNVNISGGSASLTGILSTSVAGAVSAPAFKITGAPYSGGTATTTKPLALIEPTGATSTAWNTAGTLLAVNSNSGFAGRLVDFQVNGVSQVSVDYTNGLYLRSIQTLSYSDVNTLMIGVNSVAARLAGTERLWVTGGIGFASNYASNLVAYLHVTANTFQFGATSATPAAQCIKGPNGSGTNIVGGKLELCAGQSTGNATPARLALRGTTQVASGSTAQTYADVLSVVNSQYIEIGDGVIIDGTGSGFMLGSSTASHLGFWGAGPVAQFNTSGGAGISASGSGNPVLDDSTFVGSTGSTAYTVNDLISALKLCGVLAA